MQGNIMNNLLEILVVIVLLAIATFDTLKNGKRESD